VSIPQVRPDHGSLLDPRTHSWKLTESWPTLFDLYVKNGEARVDLSPELQSIENALWRGHSVDDHDVAILERSLFKSCVINRGVKDGVGNSFGFGHLRQDVGNDVAISLGPTVEKILTASTPEQAELAAEGAINLLKRAFGGVVHTKFPSATRGNTSLIPKAVLAIWHARLLCERFRRLPTKAEVRQALEAIGISYARSKDPKGRWEDLFIRAGLSDLPE
jgi:hypothetical protein